MTLVERGTLGRDVFGRSAAVLKESVLNLMTAQRKKGNVSPEKGGRRWWTFMSIRC